MVRLVFSPPIRLTVDILRDTLASFPPEVKPNAVTESFMLGMSVLKYYFGEDWLNRFVTPDTAKDNYLRIDESDPMRRDITAFRIIDLAETMFNLQPVPGFDVCIARMRDGDIEGTYAELDFGRMLYLNQVPFAYVEARGRKGADYDVEITFPDGVIACADAKCKIEETELSANTILNTLRGARKQLPKNRPGIVFVKVPPRWLDDPTFDAIATEAANEFLRNTKRVVSVKFYAATISLKGDMMMHRHMFREIANSVTDFGNGKDWKLFHQFRLPPELNGMPPHWQRVLFFPDGKPR